jgi:hypothetical protein
MSMAKISIVITLRGNACQIDDQTPYFVTITDCLGRPLVWCKKKYIFMPTKCGHLEVDVPPGCYTVFASHNPGGIPPFGNTLTHVQVVRVNCNDHVCVTLFAPGMHYCATWFKVAVETQIEGLGQNNIDAKLARETVAALEKFIAKLTPEPYAVNVLRAIEQGPPKT